MNDITEEMIAAGAAVIAARTSLCGLPTPEEFAERIYRAMDSARRRVKSEEFPAEPPDIAELRAHYTTDCITPPSLARRMAGR